jgi:hypothetical protein
MSVIDQLALDLPGLGAPPPEVLAGLNEHDQAAVLDVLTRLIVKTASPILIAASRELNDE